MDNLFMDILNKIHVRNTEFFLTKYKEFKHDINQDKISNMTDIQLECLGYGIFDKETMLNNFSSYTLDMLEKLRQKKVEVRSLKITLNGFTLDSKAQFFQKLAKKIIGVRDALKVLWIHTSNLKGCRIQDFQSLFSLCIDLTDINFEDYSLQCANWRFQKIQPTFKKLYEIFAKKTNQLDQITQIRNKFWRLEISGWYYNEIDAKNFLGFQGDGLREYNQQNFAQQRQKFHLDMEKLMQHVVDNMSDIQEVELDMRNFHQSLKMKNLKKRMDNNVTKKGHIQKSIMSKRHDVQADEADKEFKLTVVM